MCFEWNGRPVELDDQAAQPHTSLLTWLRAAGATGSKEGCAEGECGACAVAFIEPDRSGRACFVPVNSCLVPLSAVHGRKLVSVEGVAAASGELHPVQLALVEHGGSQCGYCTPGFVVSMFCEYYRRERSGFDMEAVSGNLCRCTGYRPIASAASSLGRPAPGDPKLTVLAQQPTALPSYQSSAYVRPRDLTELFAAWARMPAATLVAGGTDLMVYVNQREQRYETLIALDAIEPLCEISYDDNALHIGAGATLTALSEALNALPRELALLEQLLPLFASRLIRNRATLGGNLATASPIGDAAPVLLALDAELTLASAAGERRLPLHELFTGYRKHALRSQELIVRVHVPRQAPPLQRFYKVSKRVLDDISTVAAAFALELAPDRTVRRLRAAYGGIAATPLRAFALEQLVQGRTWNAETCTLACAKLQTLATPIGDHRGSAAYRAALMIKLFEKFYAESTEAHHD
ncbi:MAG TPA: FAD binding domain-containing protein [Polyangiales bacterium]|nr:FAD binding domain-containing protein [Polyangiales bacterium]